MFLLKNRPNIFLLVFLYKTVLWCFLFDFMLISNGNYKNPYNYQIIYGRYFASAGAALGFCVGAGLQMVKELKEERDREMGILDDGSEF